MRLTAHPGKIVGALLAIATLAQALIGCSDAGRAKAAKVVHVLCRGDALVQPVVVPVVLLVAPAAGPASPVVAGAAAVDQALVHPLIVKACADYGAKPAAVVTEVPPGAVVAPPVTLPPVGAATALPPAAPPPLVRRVT